MAMDPEIEEEAQSLVGSALSIVEEVSALADAAEGELLEKSEIEERWQEVVAKQNLAKELSNNSGMEALRAALQALELLLFHTVSTELAGKSAAALYLPERRAEVVRAQIGRMLWLAKDALELAKDAEDWLLQTSALKTLARVHLSRTGEPDSPVAAATHAQEALDLLVNMEDAESDLEKDRRKKMHAEVLFVSADAQLTKALACPLDKAREDALEAAAATMREATELFKQLEDKRWTGRAMLATGMILVSMEDEDQQMDGERLAEDAKDYFHEAGEKDLEVVAVLAIIKCRSRTSGLDCSLLSAEDAAEDWKEEGGRPAHEAIALHQAVLIYLQQGEFLEKAEEFCHRAIECFQEAGWTRAESYLLECLGRTRTKLLKFEDAEKSLRSAVENFQNMNDKRLEARAMAFLGESLLSQLNEEEMNGLKDQEAAKKLADEGQDSADKAKKLFEEVKDNDGVKLVDEIMYAVSNAAVENYCKYNPPTRMLTTLKPDGHGAQESVGEWIIPRGEGMEPLKVRKPLNGQSGESHGYM